MTKIKIKKAESCEDLDLPRYHSENAAGFDLSSAEDLVLKPGEHKLISTGVHVEIPAGHYGMVAPRSGMGKFGISKVNAPGVVDSDYRGVVFVNLINHGKEDFKINKGDRIAQMIIKEYKKADIEEADSLSETKRGAGGFGSTGK